MVGILVNGEKVIPMRGKDVTGGWEGYDSCHDDFTAVDSSELLNGRLGSIGKTFLYIREELPRMVS